MSNAPVPERRFDLVDERGEQPRDCNQPLATLDNLIPWDQFRPVLAQALSHERRGVAEHKRFDPVLLFKAAMLKGLYGLTDIQTACQTADRLSFQRFVGLPAGPARELDTRAFSRSLWSFVEILRWQGLVYPLLDRFHEFLDKAEVRIQKGQIRDIEIVTRLAADAGGHRPGRT